jgi:hypothetical protein
MMAVVSDVGIKGTDQGWQCFWQQKTRYVGERAGL